MLSVVGMKSKDMRRLSQEAQDALRARVVAAVRGGMPRGEAARVFNVARQSITRWMKLSATQLVSRRRGRPAGRGARLSAKQAREIRRLVVDRHPEQLKLPFALWTRDAVRQLISERLGISVSRATQSSRASAGTTVIVGRTGTRVAAARASQLAQQRASLYRYRNLVLRAGVGVLHVPGHGLVRVLQA